MSRPRKVSPYDDYDFDNPTAVDTSHTPHKLFDITVEAVIGSVYEGASDLSPRSAAFLTISEYTSLNRGGPYVCKFPNEDGSIVTVTVDTQEVPGKTV